EIRDSIVASIPACHAGDRGSIPRHGELFAFSHHPCDDAKCRSKQAHPNRGVNTTFDFRIIQRANCSYFSLEFFPKMHECV
ncbi:hypothetical protein ACHAXH_010059, partial [Discostella pseudostelligera]